MFLIGTKHKLGRAATLQIDIIRHTHFNEVVTAKPTSKSRVRLSRCKFEVSAYGSRSDEAPCILSCACMHERG